jgi:integrase
MSSPLQTQQRRGHRYSENPPGRGHPIDYLDRRCVDYRDHSQIQREVKGTTSKEHTKALAYAAEHRVAKQREGEFDPRLDRMMRESRRPISEHLAEFVTVLKSKKRAKKHVDSTESHIKRIIVSASMRLAGDLTTAAVGEALIALEQAGLSHRTRNSYAIAIKSFSRWLYRDGRVSVYSLETVGRLNEDNHRVYERRALAENELQTLIAVTKTAPTWRNMTGTDRAWLYTLAATTGLRRFELWTVTPEDFDFGTRPVLALDGSRTKNHQACEQPLPEYLVPELKAWLSTKAPRTIVFRLSNDTYEMLRADLELAGIKPIDDQGRHLDMHSFRHTYGTMLALAGVALKVTQKLMRHSDPKLTMNIYSHVSPYDEHGAIEKALPKLTLPTAKKPTATGTA